MHTALFSMLLLGSAAAVIGGIIVLFAMRNAPEGYEDETGFHPVTTSTTPEPTRFAGSRHDELELAA